jgi:methyltransferase
MPPSVVAFTAFLAAIGVMRLVEIAVSRRRAAGSAAPAVAEPWLFPLMAALHAGLVTLPLVEVLALGRAASWVTFAPALTVLVGATALRIWTLGSLGRAWNVRVVPPPPDRIVTTGPYAWIRHPNYLVVILEIAAIPMLHGAWGAAVALSALNAFVLWHRIRTEEAALAEIPEWARAMADRKRLVPFLW